MDVGSRDRCSHFFNTLLRAVIPSDGTITLVVYMEELVSNRFPRPACLGDNNAVPINVVVSSPGMLVRLDYDTNDRTKRKRDMQKFTDTLAIKFRNRLTLLDLVKGMLESESLPQFTTIVNQVCLLLSRKVEELFFAAAGA